MQKKKVGHEEEEEEKETDIGVGERNTFWQKCVAKVVSR